MENNTTPRNANNDHTVSMAVLSSNKSENDKLLGSMDQKAWLESDQCKGTRDNYLYAFGMEEVDSSESES